MDTKGLEASAKTVRALSIDAIETAKSGHPGLPLGCAEIGSYLFGEVMKFNPCYPNWINRDRFVLSAGHGSMLLYSLLFLAGYNLTIDDIKKFRQLGSKTPGHPEYRVTDGVETSTGPLGQGFANAVGMALAGKRHAQKYNKPNFNVLDNRVFVLVGDGDLMEGISYEAGSLAGHLKLNNLIAVYDSNKITIEGSTNLTFTEDIAKRFEAQGWCVVSCKQAHDFADIANAFNNAEKMRIEQNKPVIIICNTTIGKGSPNKQNTCKCHGAPLGSDETVLTKQNLDIQGDFFVDPAAVEYFNGKKTKSEEEFKAWQKLFDDWAKQYPELAKDLQQTFSLEIPQSAFNDIPTFKKGDKIATRNASLDVLKAITKDLDFIISGSADLGCSTMTIIKDGSNISASDYGRHNIEYGIREHSMGAIANGMYLYGGIIPVVGTFLSFVNYMKPAIRMAAIMQIPTIYLFSHDSIYVGEDGPTHQPIEHVSSLRMLPNVNVMRPCDPNETKIAWQIALQNKTNPSIIITTRQKLPVINETYGLDDGLKGAYIIKKESKSNIDIIIISSGSEIALALEAADKLEKEGKSVRVVNMFSTYLFEKTSDEYKQSILPNDVRKRVAIEAGVTHTWYKYVGLDGKIIGIDGFGVSGKAEDVAKYFGITADNLYNVCLDLLK